MGFLDRLLGRQPTPAPAPSQPVYGTSSADEQAIERYRYLLRTAPPDDLERVHEEAFAQLTPAQRRMALERLAEAVPASEMRGASDDPRSLARVATRAELRQPGTLERVFGGGYGPGMGMGGMFAGSLLASLAGTVIGSAIAHQLFAQDPLWDAGAMAPDAGVPEAEYVEHEVHGGDPFGGEGFDDPGGFDMTEV